MSFNRILNEKYAVSYVSYNTGRVSIDHTPDDDLSSPEENFEGLIYAFSRLTGGRRESLGMQQYAVTSSPYEIVFQLEAHNGIIIVIEDMRKIDEAVRYIRDSLADINYNTLYLDRGYM